MESVTQELPGDYIVAVKIGEPKQPHDVEARLVFTDAGKQAWRINGARANRFKEAGDDTAESVT